MSWIKVKLGDILIRKRDSLKIIPDAEYRLVTIKLHHKGVVLRGIARGNTIKSRMTKVQVGDFVLSGIDARNGAFGIVPIELDNAIISNDFWCLVPNEKVIKKEFLLFITSTEYFDYICNQSSDGTTQRIRLQKDKFFNYEITIPSLSEQDQILKKLSKQKILSEETITEYTQQLIILKKLRQQILQDAMQGKLVSQDPKDEPASKLLEKIKTEKEKLIREKKIKKEKPLPEIKMDEIPFEIPVNWVWKRIGDLAQHNSGKTLDSGRNSGKPRKCITTSNLYWGYFETDNLKTILIEDEELERCTARIGDLLICEGGDAGRAAIWNLESDICFQNHIHRVRFYGKISSSYGYWYFLYLSLSGGIETYRKGMGISNLSGKSLSMVILPLPPLSEQHHIINKIEQLMKLCDELELTIEQNQKFTQDLLQVALKEALEPTNSKQD